MRIKRSAISTCIVVGFTIAALSNGASALSDSYVYHSSPNYAHAWYSGSKAYSDAQQGTATYRQGAMAWCRRANGEDMWYWAGNVTGVNQGNSTYDCANNGTYNVALDDNWSYEYSA
jgi:hypothetical protein